MQRRRRQDKYHHGDHANWHPHSNCRRHYSTHALFCHNTCSDPRNRAADRVLLAWATWCPSTYQQPLPSRSPAERWCPASPVQRSCTTCSWHADGSLAWLATSAASSFSIAPAYSLSSSDDARCCDCVRWNAALEWSTRDYRTSCGCSSASTTAAPAGQCPR